MLSELRVRNLGVIEDAAVVLGPGCTVLTGETGAGKTLLVDAIELLTGGPADPSLVYPGAAEAVIEGRFSGPGVGGEDGELILCRVVPAAGRSRCYADGRMVSAAQLAELGRSLVDLHGQHAAQSLLSPARQRAALDRAGGIDDADVVGWRRAVRELKDQQVALGGDPRSRAREIDLLSYQLSEIEAAGVEDPDEDETLRAEEDLLADAAGIAAAAHSIHEALAGEDAVLDRLGSLVAGAGGRPALSQLRERLAGAQEELSDVAGEARTLAETVEADPGRLASIGERRRVLTELRRKYGGTLAEVMAYREELERRVDELSAHDRRSGEVEAELERAGKELTAALERTRAARAAAAPGFAAAVENELGRLAMPRARFAVEVGEDPATESVVWLLAANPGQPLLPLTKVASGGELARTMLAARLVIGRAQLAERGESDGGPRTLVFDEVDAGIGGEAAMAVGQALAELAPAHQVLVVTHLAQVAACGDRHLVVTKEVKDDRTVARVTPVEGSDRVVELARMLSGQPDSEAARIHAEELLSGPVQA